jgi:hypothetical protein
MPLLYATSSTTMFSASRRAAAKPQLEAEILFRGMPSMYFTISPADMDSAVMLRMCDGTQHMNRTFSFPPHQPDAHDPGLRERMHMAVRNPRACALVFHAMAKAVIECLIGLELDTKKTTHCTKRGIFGLPSSVYAVLECQGRGALHMHCLFFGGVSPDALMRIAHLEPWKATTAAYIDSMCTAQLPAELHESKKAYRGALYDSPPVSSVLAYANHAQHSAKSTQIHKCCLGCFKRGPFCR